MTYRLPSLNTLRAFEAAARHLNFRAAADEIGVTSGAVSQQVRKLEYSLGVTLFQRLPHGLLLTASGETFLPRITKVFEDLTDATEAIAPDMNGKKFSVGIGPGVSDSLPDGWPMTDPLLKPHVRERVIPADLELVKSGAVDCLVRKSGGSSGLLQSFKVSHIPGKADQESPDGEKTLYLICKTGLAQCVQIDQILTALKRATTGTQQPTAPKPTHP